MSPENGKQTGFDADDHQTAYIFAPSVSPTENQQRPQKRRKISEAHEAEIHHDQLEYHFPTLLNGLERKELVELRQQLYEKSWNSIDERIDRILRNANEKTLAEVKSFINQGIFEIYKGNIPTGLIVTGPNIASQELLFNQIAETLRAETRGLVVVLRSGDASNLKTLLKKVIREATNQKDDDDDEHLAASRHDGRKLLNYDLQILQDYLQASDFEHITIAFQDSEAFDSNLLTELICLLNSWLDRIPIVALFGIATSVELFHERLSREAIRCLKGAQFDVEQTGKTLQTIFNSIILDLDIPLRIGSSFMSTLLDRQDEHVQSLQAFISALKYAYMCHFYANPLSILLAPDLQDVVPLLQEEHLDAIRNLPSFKPAMEQLVQQGNAKKARELITSNMHMKRSVTSALDDGKHFLLQQILRIRALVGLASTTANTIDPMEIYIQAFSGKLNDLETIQNILDTVKRSSPQELVKMIDASIEHVQLEEMDDTSQLFCQNLNQCRAKATTLRTESEEAGQSLQSRYTIQRKTLRTTVVAQKVQLSKQESTLLKQDAAFTEVVDKTVSLFEEYFTFPNPKGMFLHETWLYDSKSPYTSVFTPRPRHAVERALSAPHDYLGCECCKGTTGGLSSSQPPTAILYQLYLETGGLINVFDLWSAFYTIVGGENGEEHDERSTLALFYRALADLKLLGMVKQSRKKTDHLAKLAWKGL